MTFIDYEVIWLILSVWPVKFWSAETKKCSHLDVDGAMKDTKYRSTISCSDKGLALKQGHESAKIVEFYKEPQVSPPRDLISMVKITCISEDYLLFST